MVHHKSDKAGAADMRGSSGIRANYDTVIRVNADKASKIATVHVRRHGTSKGTSWGRAWSSSRSRRQSTGRR